ncbi:MAG TPA: c-type cytochrome [bacterium]|nr:c-type cytochrome [bacterium]
MADFKDERAYDSKTLVRWFLVSSLLLWVCVVIMAIKDYDRSWKHYERSFNNMVRKHTASQWHEAGDQISVDDYWALKGQVAKAEGDLKADKVKIDELTNKGADLDAKIFKKNKFEYQALKAQIGADSFVYGEAMKNGEEAEAEKLKKTLDAENDRANALNQQVFEMTQERDQITKDLASIESKKTEAEQKLQKLTANFDALKTKVHSLNPPFRLFNANTWGPYILFHIRNAMFLDFMAPTIQVQQVVLKNLPEDLYFAKTMRVDRCMSCHLGIDKKGFDEAHYPGIPKVFRSHPNLELYVGSTSPHPMEKVGCTVCHGGMGQALDFNTAAHVANDEQEAKVWHKKYGWAEPEGVQSMMMPLKFTEGSCLKCHGTQEHVNFAPKLNRGRELMATRGCVGCHKVQNLEGLTKAGPELYKVKGKLKKDFVLKWVWNPTGYNPKAKMPAFFGQTNNSDPDTMAKNKAELNAIVDYIYDKSEDYQPPYGAPGGSVAAGKKLFKEVGCLACHGINDVTSMHADFAPDLSSVGSKLTASFIYSWVKNPQHFNPDTRMPSLRLSDREAADITAYLMSKKNKDFEQTLPPAFDPAVRDALLADYLAPQEGQSAANAHVLNLDEHDRMMLLGERALNKYACFACHMIKGFETTPGIGTELTTWASKRVTQLDFGFTDEKLIPHTHEGFLYAKLSNPRQFDKDKVVAFADKLRMPNFHLDEEDKESIMTAVLGLSQTYIPDEMMAGIHGDGPLLEKGRRVIADFNCRGCHLIEASGKSIDEMLDQGQGGRILGMYKKEGIDYSMGPPNLNTEGAKLQVDWFHDFLTGVHPIRPWLHIRMPSFPWTEEKVSKVITYFNLKDDQVFPFKNVKTHKLTGNDLAEAKALFTKLQCQKCHIVGSHIPPDINSAAPDLLQVHKRLNPDWVVRWLENPSAIMPDTRMTGFWPKGDDGKEIVPDPKAFGGDGLKQREALRDYLFMLGKGQAN